MHSFRSTALLSFLKRISALRFGLPMAILLVTLGLTTGGSQSAWAQPELTSETFSLSVPVNRRSLVPYSHDGTTELCFAGDTPVNGRELLCTDGSDVRVVADIWSGPEDSDPRFLTVYDDGSGPKLYFQADDGINGHELFVYDGSSVQLAADINSGPGHSYPESFAVYDDGSGSKLYFRANAGTGAGDELYAYDGSSVALAADVNPGNAGSTLGGATVYDDGSGPKLYFRADADGDGYELWRYDGSSATQVADINSGSDDSYPTDLTVYDDGTGPKLYFSANNGTDGEELFVYDGSSVTLAADVNSGSEGSEPQSLTVYDDGSGPKLYFQATDGSSGAELWSYDGSNASLAADIRSGSDGSEPEEFAVYDDGSGAKLYFRATRSGGDSQPLGSKDASSVAGTELFVYDGSNASLAADVRSGPFGSRPQNLTVYDDGSGKKLYFSASLVSESEVLVRYDGSSAARLQLANSPLGTLDEKTVFQGDLYFRARNGSDGFELWRYDGSTIEQIADLNPGPPSSNPRDLTVYDDGSGPRPYFRARDGSNGQELFAWDGSSVSLVEDINPGSRGSRLEDFAVYDAGSGPKLYFQAFDGTDNELFVYDGSSVQMAANINSGSDYSSPQGLIVYDDGSGPKLYFQAKNGSSGRELFVYDGSSASLAADIQSGDSSFPTQFAVYDDGSGPKLYFQAYDGTNGYELWSYDGSSASLAADINTGGAFTHSDPEYLTVYDDGTGPKLYFEARNGSNGDELFVYDGSSVRLVKDINSGSLGSSPRDLAVYNGRLYFVATNGSDGYEPHSYNGSQVQTVDLNSGPVGGGGLHPAVYDDGSGEKLYVTATDGQTGMELYRFDRHNAPLPVEFTSFDATQTGRSAVELTWQTASETNNAGFEVQHRSAKPSRRDGSTASSAETARVWEKIGFVEGGGTTSETQTYRFTAEDLAVGTHRFRLKQVDLDGTTYLYDPVTVELQMDQALRLSAPAPNPVEGTARISFAVREQAEARITLYNTLGQRVRVLYHRTPTAGEAQTVRIEAGDLPSGTYFLRLRANGQTKTRRLTVMR